jgi:cytochrome c peroxidase
MKRTLALCAVLLATGLAACVGGDVASPSAPPPSPTARIPTTDDAGADAAADSADAGGYAWDLPSGFPVPRVPEDNPMNPMKVALGRRLFYDTRLSGNGTFSCGSCHEQARAFTDGRATAVGSTGESHPRASMSLANVAYASGLTWASSLMTSLEKQALVPMFGDNPIELGTPDEAALLARLAVDPAYAPLFRDAFPEKTEPSLDAIVKALAAFQRTLISGRSPYDRHLAGDASALSAAAKRGLDLFFSEKLECYHCHVGFAFSDSIVHAGSAFFELSFHNTGLYDVDGKGAYPAGNRGLIELTNKPSDMGRFRAPTLRNIAVTAPYMHDGSVATLDDALDHYAAGGRTLSSGPFAGDGSKNPLKDDLIRGFVFTGSEKSDVIAFLESLTDATFLADPRHSDPFAKPQEPSSP